MIIYKFFLPGRSTILFSSLGPNVFPTLKPQSLKPINDQLNCGSQRIYAYQYSLKTVLISIQYILNKKINTY